MANHKSALKAHRVSLKKNIRNSQGLSRIKTFIKKLEASIESKEVEQSRAGFSVVESEIMRGVKKGILKLNTASRKVSRLSKKVKNLSIV